MESTNFLDCFEVDLTSHILAFLNDPADLLRASAVSRPWRHPVIANRLCKKLWLIKFPHVAHIAYVDEGSDGIIRRLDVASKDAANWRTLEREHKSYSTLLLPLAKPISCPKMCPSFPIGASTDHDLNQGIIHTMVSLDRYAQSAPYWSCGGQIDPDFLSIYYTNYVLTYALLVKSI